MPLFFSRVASATRCPHIDMADSTVDAVGRRPRNLGSSAWTPTSPQRSCPLCGHRNGAGWGLHCPSRTYFSLTRLRPDLRGLQENAVLAGEVRLRAGTTYCAVGRSPASCHNQGAAAPRGDIRRIRGSFCSVTSRLSDNQALLGARLPAKLPGSTLLRAALPELLEPERHPLGGIGIRAIHGLNVEMGLRGVPGVAASADLIAGAQPLTWRHLNRPSLKVHESNVIRAARNLDDDVIPEDRGQSPPNPPGLAQSVRDECQHGAARLMVGFAVVSRHHSSCNG